MGESAAASSPAAWPGRWTMSTRRVQGGIDVAIGAVRIARIRFVRPSRAQLWIEPADEAAPSAVTCASVSDALTLVHRMLRAPPPDDWSTGR